MTENQNQHKDNLLLELRRGVTTLAVLIALDDEKYGYSLQSTLAGSGIDIDQGTLYPLLRRLEGQGLLTSSWRVEEARPRRYYTLSSEGQNLLPEIIQEWKTLVQLMDTLISNAESEKKNETD